MSAGANATLRYGIIASDTCMACGLIEVPVTVLRPAMPVPGSRALLVCESCCGNGCDAFARLSWTNDLHEAGFAIVPVAVTAEMEAAVVAEMRTWRTTWFGLPYGRFRLAWDAAIRACGARR